MIRIISIIMAVLALMMQAGKPVPAVKAREKVTVMQAEACGIGDAAVRPECGIGDAAVRVPGE